jgi:hypothetical protein
VLLAPVALYFHSQTRDARYLWLCLSTLPIFAANVIGNHVTGSQNGLLNYNNAGLIPESLADNFALRLFILPLLGARPTAELMSTSNLVFWSGCAAGAGLFAMLWRRGLYDDASPLSMDRPVVVLLVGYSCATAAFALIAVSRTYAAPQIIRQFGDPLWHLRYAYLPGALAILLWATILGRLTKIGGYGGLAFVGLAIITSNQLEQWNNYPVRRDAHWPTAAHAIEAALNARQARTLTAPVTVKVPVHPANWHDGTIDFVIEPR